VLFPDNFVNVRSGVGSRRDIERAVNDLRPGVTEVYVHPAADSPELRAATPDWAARVDDLDLVTRDRSLRAMLDRLDVHLIGYRALRNAQRAG
jgi:hypothetical protein